MATVNEKMTALADEIRELSGTTTSKGIDAMTSDVDAANAEIAEQTGLLAQIATALEGKAAGSGGGGSIETCTVTIVTQGVGSSKFNTFYPVIFNSNNNEIECSSYSYMQNSSTECGGIVKGSILVCTDVTNAVTISCSTGATKLFLKNNIAAFFIAPDAPDSVTITLSNT